MSELGLSTRVVILSPDAAGASDDSAALRAEGVEVVRVSTAYEAAAELIAAPAAALVVDLRLLGPRHLRLLTIAREGQVEILAVGGLPAGMNSEDLSGARLLSRSDLTAALKKLVGGGPAVAAQPALQDLPAEDLAEETDYEAEDFGEESDEPAAEAEAELAPAKVSPEEIQQELDYQSQRAQAPAAAPLPKPAAPPAPPPEPAHDAHKTLLTPQELAALLENDA
jgi:hypothetical protein